MSATTSERVLRIGTRTSTLAVRQTERVIRLLQNAWPELRCHTTPFVTTGDRAIDQPLPEIGGKGLFTAELEKALLSGEIDLAVHSLKDLPVEESPGLSIGAIAEREDVRDVLVAKIGWTLATLPSGAVVGTCSLRREAQLRAARPDLKIRQIRGNVETRVRKVTDGDFDATVLAAAGLLRLGLLEAITEWLPLETMLPAPGQGALAVQCRRDDVQALTWLRAIDDPTVRLAVTAERAFLQALGGGCSAPIAAHCTIDKSNGASHLTINAVVASPDGTTVIRVSGNDSDPVALARRLADEARRGGANRILAGDQRPLTGKRVVVTRPVEQAEGVIAALVEAGAVPIHVPAIRFEPIGEAPQIAQAMAEIESFDWIVFTSANGVRFFRQVCGDWPRARVAAVGPATAAALREAGIDVDFVPDEFTGETLARTLGNVSGRRVLLPRAELANTDVVRLLRDRGALVEELPIYRTLSAGSAELLSATLAKGVDCILFASASAVRNVVDAPARSAGDLKSIPAVCIGPVTAETARSLGLNVVAIADSHTTAGLIDALTGYFRGQESKS
jgi:hydroxymethylbilane synthase